MRGAWHLRRKVFGAALWQALVDAGGGCRAFHTGDIDVTGPVAVAALRVEPVTDSAVIAWSVIARAVTPVVAVCGGVVKSTALTAATGLLARTPALDSVAADSVAARVARRRVGRRRSGALLRRKSDGAANPTARAWHGRLTPRDSCRMRSPCVLISGRLRPFRREQGASQKRRNCESERDRRPADTDWRDALDIPTRRLIEDLPEQNWP